MPTYMKDLVSSPLAQDTEENEGKYTCKRPLSSRSPRSLTNTISSKDRRTRSNGSETAAASPSPVSAIFGYQCFKRYLWCRQNRKCGRNCCALSAAKFRRESETRIWSHLSLLLKNQLHRSLSDQAPILLHCSLRFCCAFRRCTW